MDEGEEDVIAPLVEIPSKLYLVTPRLCLFVKWNYGLSIATPSGSSSDYNPPAEPKPKPKPPVEENRKDNINIVFIGHVDAGKSTISGHILLLTGQVMY